MVSGLKVRERECMDPTVKQWRDDTAGCANQIHFNNAGAGLMPRGVLEAIIGHLNRETNFGGYESADDAEAAVADAYANVARVLGTGARNIAVVENSTVAFFQAMSAFDFKRCDFFSGAARKFLRGPRGVGFLYVSGRALQRGDFPLYIDMRGADWVSANGFAPAPDARRFESWEFACSLVLGMGEAARYALEVGMERGGRRAREVARTLRGKLGGLNGIRVLDRGSELAALGTTEASGWGATELSKLLRTKGSTTSTSLRAYA